MKYIEISDGTVRLVTTDLYELFPHMWVRTISDILTNSVMQT